MIPAILLLALGLGLILAEVLFPSFGVLSVLATAAIVAAVALAFRESTASGVRFLVATALLVPGAILIGFKLFPRSPFGRRMVAGGLSFESTPALDRRDVELLGQEGELEAPCRPAGMARIAGRRVDVVTRGEWLERGERVRVVEVQGNRVVVARPPERS
jgi:membrane-bound serine protease (ClpP class)